MKNKISLGTANLNNNYGLNRKKIQFSSKEIKKILKLSAENKIKNIDTAIRYRGVEKKLGKFNLNKFKISTKLSPISLKCKNIEKKIFTEIEHSIKKLNVKNIEIIFLHDSNELIYGKRKFKIYDSLIKVKKKGLIKKIGVSVYSLVDLKKVLDNFKIDVVQVPYSLIDRRFEKTFSLLKKKKINIQVRSIFLQGLLLYNYKNLPKYFFKFKELKKLDKWIKKYSISRLEAAISFVKQSKFIDSFVVGFNNFNQLKEIIRLFSKNNNKFPTNLFSDNIKLIDPRKWKIN